MPDGKTDHLVYCGLGRCNDVQWVGGVPVSTSTTRAVTTSLHGAGSHDVSGLRALGPGLLEKCYEACLEYELKDRGLKVERQKEMPVRYGNILVETGYKIDLLVDDKVVIELKAVSELNDIFRAQTLTYLKIGGYRLGYLINFNVLRLVDGLQRLAYHL